MPDIRHHQILLIDDSEDDVVLISYGLKSGGIRNEIIHLPDAEQFLSHMNLVVTGREAFPALVLLDVNLPGMSGHEALRHMRAIKEFEKIPAVAMVSHSKARKDIEEAMSSGASGYLTKPATDEEWQAFCNFIKDHLKENLEP